MEIITVYLSCIVLTLVFILICIDKLPERNCYKTPNTYMDKVVVIVASVGVYHMWVGILSKFPPPIFQ